ncbi:YybH family protein [Dyella sp. 2RAB6]|uniref:YybH family protein n=1 Tax=Dyella sp. 2RAB6 TaxID=3232992 RepID=UPI003F8ED2CB
MKPLLPALFLLAASLAPVHAKEAANVPQARAQIQQLVEQFKTAIKAHDGEGMAKLFMPGGSWFQSLDDASWAKVKTREPNARQVMPDDYQKFSQFVGKATKPIEETFDNVRIETDGTIGTVYFDYVFLQSGKPTNHGAETWQLVRTPDGWKISAMLYSVVLDDMR